MKVYIEKLLRWNHYKIDIIKYFVKTKKKMLFII